MIFFCGTAFAFLRMIEDKKDVIIVEKEMVFYRRFTRKSNYFNRLMISAAFIFIFILSAGTVHAQDSQNYQWSKSVRSLAIFQPGDAVRIEVFELFQQGDRQINLTRNYPINPDGSIVMPIIGEVKVKGYTAYEVAQKVREEYQGFLNNPYVYVRPLIRLTLIGAFQKPGAYHVDPSGSLWSVVELGGGPSHDADIKRLNVQRGGSIVYRDLLREFERGVSLEEVGVESGDQIVLPGRSSVDIQFLMTIVNLFASIVLLYLRLRTGAW